MTALRLAIHAGAFQRPLRQILPEIARLEVEGVQLEASGELHPQGLSETARRQVRKLFEDHDLRVAAIEFRPRRGFHVADELDRRVEAARRTIVLASQLGASIVVCPVGRVSPEADPAGFQQQVDVLRDLGTYGVKHGALLAAETGTESGADLRRLIDALPEETLGAAFDPGQLLAYGHSADDALRSLADRIWHVHAHDGYRDVALGRGVEAMLGRGSVDWETLLGTLQEHAYRGWMTIVRHQARDAQAELRQAVQFLRRF